MTRELLGSADVSDDHLAAMVADLLGEPSVELLDVTAEPVDYELPAITTGGRWWVSGRARSRNGDAPFRLFVKLVQNWSRSPYFEMIPPEVREMAAASVPWRTEPNIYRSDLETRLPAGLSMPRALDVVDIDDLSSAVWLEAVPVHAWPWDRARYERAAYLLGRLAGSPRVAPLAQIDDHRWTVHDYVDGRLTHQVIPMLLDDGLWSHPLIAAAYAPELRDRLRAAVALVPAWIDELASAPQLTGHGDACPNNLLGTSRRDEFVLIDYGFWKPLPLGFDLGQLLLGDVQLGRRGAGDLAELDTALVASYAAGLADEGRTVDVPLLERLHALQMTVFSGLSSVPVEHLGAPPSAELEQLVATRAAISAYCLGRVEATG